MNQEKQKQIEDFIRIIHKHELRNGDLLLIDTKAGIDPEAFQNAKWPPDMPRVNVLFVDDVNSIKHIPLGWKPEGLQPGKVSGS